MMDWDMQSDTALQYAQACHVVLNFYEQVFGKDFHSIRKYRAQVNLDCALYSNHLHDLKGAIAYMNDAVKVKPVAARIQFYQARFLYLDKQYATVIPLLQHLVTEQATQLSNVNYYEANQMLVTSLDKEKRHSEAQFQFMILNIKKKTQEETLNMRYAFYQDFCPYHKMVEPKTDNTEFRFHELKVLFAEYDMPFYDENEQFMSCPRRLKVANLEGMKTTSLYHKVYSRVVDGCSGLFRFDDPENYFAHFVHRALAYYEMKDYQKAYQDCSSATEHVNSRTDLQQVCSAVWASVAQVTFLSTTALINLYPKEGKAKIPRQFYEIKIKQALWLGADVTCCNEHVPDAQRHFSSCRQVIDEYEKEYGASTVASHKVELELAGAKLMKTVEKFAAALKHTLAAIKIVPLHYRAMFKHAKMLYNLNQHSMAIPYLQDLVQNHETDLGVSNFMAANQTLLECLDHEHKHTEANILFNNIVNRDMGASEWIGLFLTFQSDKKRLAKIVKKMPDKKIVTSFGFAMVNKSGMNDEDYDHLPHHMQVQIITSKKFTLRLAKNHLKLIEICTKLMEIDPWNKFLHYVHRALAYFNLNQHAKAKQDCTTAMQFANKELSLEDAFDGHVVTVQEIKFLRTTALAAKFDKNTNDLKYKTDHICSNCLAKVAIVKHCTKCKEVYYCNAECQQQHWPEHKKLCKKQPSTK